MNLTSLQISPFEDSFRDNVRCLLTRGIEICRSCPEGPAAQDEAVRSLRKTLCAARAILRLQYGAEIGTASEQIHQISVGIREVRGRLSEMRDASAVVNALNRLKRQYPGELDRKSALVVARVLRMRRQALRERLLVRERALDGAAESLTAYLNTFDGTPVRPAGMGEVMLKLARARQRICQTMAIAKDSSSDDMLHDWRKAIQVFRHNLLAMEQLQPTLGGPAKLAEEIASCLGEDRDYALLHELLERGQFPQLTGEDKSSFVSCIAKRRTQLDAIIWESGQRLIKMTLDIA